MPFSVLFFLCLTAVGVYAILGAGWCRNRKYSMLGAVRAVAQSVSYEIRLSIIVIHVLLFYNYKIYQIKYEPLFRFLFPVMLLLVITTLAESNRSPFDFSEGESELVRGFNTEYSSVSFVIIFLAEYISILFMCIMTSSVFLIRNMTDIFLFTVLLSLFFIWTRGRVPRYRYDQLIYIAWKCFCPTVLCSAALTVVL